MRDNSTLHLDTN